MTKRGPLSKIEKFYIEQHLEKDMDELCAELDRAKVTVENHVRKVTRPKRGKKTRISEQIFSNKQGSTVMTENGSMLSDEFRKATIPKRRDRPECTTYIRSDDE